MAENSKIEWTDHTFNPWRGCVKVSEGCKNCYAEKLSGRNPATLGVWGSNGMRVVAAESYWKLPLKWNRIAQGVQAAIPGNTKRPRVFCASLADVFEDWDGPMVNSRGLTMLVSYGDGGKHMAYEGQTHYPGGHDWCDMTMNDVRARLFDLIDATPNLDWLILTKRPENIRRMWPETSCESCGEVSCAPHRTGVLDRQYRENVWLLTSIENQATADERIPHLLKCRDLCPVLGLSIEPVLGPVDLSGYFGGEYVGLPGDAVHQNYNFGIDWVIVGGESGPNARPMHPEWARTIRDQCQAAGVPFFFKQWGEWVPWEPRFSANVKHTRNDGSLHDQPIGAGASGEPMVRVGKKAAGRLLDGREWNEFPQPEPREVE